MESRTTISTGMTRQHDENAIAKMAATVSDAGNPDMTCNESNALLQTGNVSKRQAKKQRMEQEKRTQRKEKRAREKMKKKMKRAAQREAGCIPLKRSRISQMGNSKCKQRVAVDMQFENLMRPKDIRHLFVQLAHSYAVNRRAENPLQFSVVAFCGPQNKQFFDNPNNHHWDVIFEERPLDEVFEKNEIVYLTADSENSLQTLDSSKVYVIGGLLDHNSLKGHCLKLAKEKGYAHARLPISEYITLRTRKVLTVNQVFEILLRYTENHSWKKSFLDVIPRRKGIVDGGNCSENVGNSNVLEKRRNDTTGDVDDADRNTNEAVIEEMVENIDKKLVADNDELKTEDSSDNNGNNSENS